MMSKVTQNLFRKGSRGWAKNNNPETWPTSKQTAGYLFRQIVSAVALPVGEGLWKAAWRRMSRVSILQIARAPIAKEPCREGCTEGNINSCSAGCAQIRVISIQRLPLFRAGPARSLPTPPQRNNHTNLDRCWVTAWVIKAVCLSLFSSRGNTHDGGRPAKLQSVKSRDSASLAAQSVNRPLSLLASLLSVSPEGGQHLDRWWQRRRPLSVPGNRQDAGIDNRMSETFKRQQAGKWQRNEKRHRSR